MLRSSIDFTDLEVQEGDEPVVPFSYDNEDKELKNQVVCHVSWTNENTKKVIIDNIHKSPLYSGMIEGLVPDIAQVSKTRLSDFPRSLAISFLSSRAEKRRKRCIYRE